MEAMIKNDIARDVSKFEKTPEGWYKLPDESYADFELCIADTEQWIKSVGKNLKTGELFASPFEKSFQSVKKGWECLWIR
jgi:hypothetical protein